MPTLTQLTTVTGIALILLFANARGQELDATAKAEMKKKLTTKTVGLFNGGEDTTKKLCDFPSLSTTSNKAHEYHLTMFCQSKAFKHLGCVGLRDQYLTLAIILDELCGPEPLISISITGGTKKKRDGCVEYLKANLNKLACPDKGSYYATTVQEMVNAIIPT